jgi:hypothetical protein
LVKVQRQYWVTKLVRSRKEVGTTFFEALSDAGVLHNDIALRNFVRSRDDPNRAKIIDMESRFLERPGLVAATS